MFGLTPDLLDKMYGGSENIPTRGILTTSTGLGHCSQQAHVGSQVANIFIFNIGEAFSPTN